MVEADSSVSITHKTAAISIRIRTADFHRVGAVHDVGTITRDITDKTGIVGTLRGDRTCDCQILDGSSVNIPERSDVVI